MPKLKELTEENLNKKTKALVMAYGIRCKLCGLTANKIKESGNEKQILVHQGDLGICTNMTKDHIIPRSFGGFGGFNYQLLCLACNSKKGDNVSPVIIDELLEKHGVSSVVSNSDLFIKKMIKAGHKKILIKYNLIKENYHVFDNDFVVVG